jgi:hypothetical protein
VRKSISYGVFEGRDDNQCAGVSTTYRFDLSDGGQEGGSSGGPVFDNVAHRIRAVVTCSQQEPPCLPGQNAWEGSFADGYSVLQPFLDAQNDVWVNGIYAGAERGTVAQPWNSLIEGYFGVNSGGVIHIQAGSYPPVTLSFGGSRSMTLRAEGGTVVIGQ